MKHLLVKNTSKKRDTEIFTQLSNEELILIKGGTMETPPDDEEDEKNK
ncbi:MAG: hypothetical protein PF517_10335 [Salinivirgaceae bacterium]|jgi:hypothetical protein|nr:hypothetical protein [Salinivirgaceae bacterium]